MRILLLDGHLVTLRARCSELTVQARTRLELGLQLHDLRQQLLARGAAQARVAAQMCRHGFAFRAVVQLARHVQPRERRAAVRRSRQRLITRARERVGSGK